MNVDIAGKVVVVTGAAQGIGRTLALGLAADGAPVAVLARDRKRAQLVVNEIEALADRTRAVVEEIETLPDRAQTSIDVPDRTPAAVEETGALSNRPPAALGKTGALPDRAAAAVGKAGALPDRAPVACCQPEDLVGLTAFLCSDAANHLSGSVIYVRPPISG
jgi:NAD(P)-dependent dehydrogenase (short-subunit alcohol dehydrogenase family)